MVTVYTKDDCNPCKATKRRLVKRGILFNEVNVNTDPQALEEIKDMGYMGVPVVVTATSNWNGFRPELIDEIV